MNPIDFYFDPACPWTWITSRWVTEVAGPRRLDITWRTFSLRYRNKDNPGYDWIRDELDRQYPGVRVIEAARVAHGDDAVARLYTSFGTLIHHDGDSNLDRLADGIALAGLPADLIDAGNDPKWDEVIEASTRMGWDIIGDDAGIPLIVAPSNPTVFFGPVLSPAPHGQDAVDLWDAFMTLGRFDGLYEIKRSRDVRPIFGPRPDI
jgi:hypothetical protein